MNSSFITLRPELFRNLSMKPSVDLSYMDTEYVSMGLPFETAFEKVSYNGTRLIRKLNCMGMAGAFNIQQIWFLKKSDCFSR